MVVYVTKYYNIYGTVKADLIERVGDRAAVRFRGLKPRYDIVDTNEIFTTYQEAESFGRRHHAPLADSLQSAINFHQPC